MNYTHTKRFTRILLALGFAVAGALHFTNDLELAQIVPPFLPFPMEIVWFTGVLEFVFALALLIPRFLRYTGIVISLFCLAVLPANIYMAIADIPLFGQNVDTWILWLRIPAQFGLITIILWATGFFEKNDGVIVS